MGKNKKERPGFTNGRNEVSQGITREDRIRNETIRNELQVEPLEEKAEKYKQRWIDHLNRLEEIGIPSAIRGYNPKGRRNIGRPRKRW